MSQCARRRFYEDGCLVPFEEDVTHEFKAHRNLGADEIPPWCYAHRTDRRTRKAVSRTICAYLNSGIKGTVYLGIIDQGVCKGICLTKHQKNHILVSMKDLMKRFQPPVSENLYSNNQLFWREEFKFLNLSYKLATANIEFVPVQSSKEVATDTEDIGKDDLASHLKGHLLRTFESCWCDIEAMEEIDAGKVIPKYVVEICVMPLSPGFRIAEDEEHQLVLPPIYLNEEKLCLFRQNASCVQYSMQEIHDLTVKQIDEAYKPLIEKLSEELSNFSVYHQTRNRGKQSVNGKDTETQRPLEEIVNE